MIPVIPAAAFQPPKRAAQPNTPTRVSIEQCQGSSPTSPGATPASPCAERPGEKRATWGKRAAPNTFFFFSWCFCYGLWTLQNQPGRTKREQVLGAAQMTPCWLETAHPFCSFMSRFRLAAQSNGPLLPSQALDYRNGFLKVVVLFLFPFCTFNLVPC